MASQMLFSDLMAAAAVVAAASSASSAIPSTVCTTSAAGGVVSADAMYGGATGAAAATNKNFLEDQRALQLAFELSMLNNGGNGDAGNIQHPCGSNSSSISSTSSLGHTNNGLNGPFYLNAASNNGDQRDYDNVLQHFLAANGPEATGSTLNNLGHHHLQQSNHQQSYDDITIEKLLLSQNMVHNSEINQHSAAAATNPAEYYRNTATLNNIISGMSSMNMNQTNVAGGPFNGHGHQNNHHNQHHHQQSHNNNGTGLLNETERFKKSQNMTECVPVPSSEHVAEIVGRQGCKIKALRAKTNTYIKTPVRGEEPVFVVTGRKEDVAKAKKEILSAAEHFSLIRASRKSSLTTSSNAANGHSLTASPLLVAGFGGSSVTGVGSNGHGLGDIFSSSSSGDNSPSILTKNPIGLANSGHNQITVQVRVPYRVVGLVVGPKGATIKNIQQQTHTYIVTPSRDKEPIFEVTGAVENVEVARQQIEAHIAMRTGGNSESTDNLTNYLNSINESSSGMKRDSQDELQILQENFGQSTAFLRKYLNNHQDDQSDYTSSAYDAQGKSPNMAQMELLMSQLYPSGHDRSGGNGDVFSMSSTANAGQAIDGNDNTLDLFANRMRIDDLIQSMQQQQQQQKQGSDFNKRSADENVMMGRNMFADIKSSGGKAAEYFGQFNDMKCAQQMSHQLNDDSTAMRRQLLSNNSEDDEGVGLELQESSPQSNNGSNGQGASLMKMIMDGADDNKKYMWSSLANANKAKGTTGIDMLHHSNAHHSSDSSCLSSASPSPTLSKFFTFQGNTGNHNGNTKPRNGPDTMGDLPSSLM